MVKNHDAQWYSQLIKLTRGNTDEAEWIQGHMHIDLDERDRFFDNEIENPLLEYRHTKSIDSLTSLKSDELHTLLADVETAESDDIVRDLYVRKIKKQCVRIDLLNASLAKNDKEFYRLSCQLHGKPQKKYFAYIAKQVNGMCKLTAETCPSEVRRLKKIFSKISTTDVDISADILPPVVAGGKVLKTTDEVIAIFQETLDHLQIKGWSLVVDTSGQRSRFSVQQANKIVHIPSAKQLQLRPRPLTDVQVEALAAHEIGVHVRRAQNGAASGLDLLQHGLDSYLAGEEGLASYMQQQCEGGTEFYGFDRYMAASLAVGLDGTRRDFRAVFSTMVDYYTIQASLAKREDRIVPIRAAWDVCVRIFRGTTGQSAGYIYTKDIVYMEGNIGIWHLLSERPHVFPLLFLGKFNPLMPKHVKALQSLEIITDW